MTHTLLERLFPGSRATLLESWRAGRWVHAAGSLDRVPGYSELSSVTLAEMLMTHPELFGDAYGAEDGARTASDASPARRPLRSWERLGAEEALAHYQHGHTLVYWDVGPAFPFLLEGARAIAQEVGCLPPEGCIAGAPPKIRGFDSSAFRVALSFTPKDADVGLGAHFDQFDSIAVQVRGEKDWYVAPSSKLQFPLHNEGAVSAGLPPYMTLMSLEASSAGEFRRVRMTPGAALLNPRGTWHATGGTADVESVTVLYRFQFPSWLDVITASLREELLRAPELRQTAFGVFRDANSTDLAEVDVARRCARATAALARGPALIEEGLLARLSDRRRARFSLVDGTRLVDADGRLRILYPDAEGSIELPQDVRQAFSWIAASGGAGFSLRALQEAAPAARDAAWAVLRCLVDARVLAVRWASTAELRDDA